MENVLAIILGFLFGYVLYLSGASSPKKLISMLRLENLELMKIIIFGIGFASALLSLAGLTGVLNLAHLGVKGTNLGVITGGLLFGIGFGTVGTCPGTCVAATGSGGYKKAVSAVFGGLTGAWLFSVTYEYWKQIGLFSIMNLGKLTLFKITDAYDAVFPIGFMGLLIVAVLFMVIGLILPVNFKSNSSSS
ncbi:YeeE/YedE thiosulfate transporter family protein [uncultured Clostridium sp.]|uniref:YeeE/YedE thiosulfate transporter family protein n=1 Tax=uncultured Clostridium sp. TaxID=59620 RepID=UPI0025D6A767|nr:YeeE/YedE thiosulfate transporter family protein [uncultured Clostridium sp.]